MAQAVRQSELFAAEDWKVVYRAFSEVNFNAYDFDSIRESMIQYIRLNFPEDFNDWIESSEFIALVDLLAYLGQSLAFRMDINARENFIDTAERRESVLRLARLISYNPRRNLPATGLVKIQQVLTDESILDSNGVNLANTPVAWNDPDNPDWFERFILVLNAAFIKTNPFGRAVSSGRVGSIPTQIYELNNSQIARGVFPFTARTSGGSFPFEIVNADFTDGESFFERSPNPLSPFRLIYRNDGRGNQSSNSGFFLMFRQGTLGYQDFQLDIPLENRLINLDIDDINDQDVWVQEVGETGRLLSEWTKVPAVVGNNVIYNSLTRTVRNIYSVNTRERDQVAIRFADGRFGNVPTGTYRIWYRQSAGRYLDIHPKDMSGLTLTIPYLNSRGEPHNIALQYSLEYTVRNSQPRESIDAIKRRAPQVYYSQNRMVNGEDYNVFPLSTNRALKLKAINRTYSGHSRFIDLNDPTGSYQNTNVVADDGLLYREFEQNYDEEPLPTSKDASEFIQDRIVPLLQDRELANFFNWYMTSLAEEKIVDPVTREVTYQPFQTRFRIPPVADSDARAVRWWRASNALFSTTGVLGRSAGAPWKLGEPFTGSLAALFYVTEGASLKFEKSGWATVQTIRGDGDILATNGPGPVVLNQAIQDGDRLQYVIPAFRTTLTTAEIDEISSEIQNDNSFGLGYSFATRRWQVIQSVYLDETANYDHVWDYNFRTDSSWLIKVIRTATAWQVTARGLQYVFESKDDVRFFFLNRYKTVDLGTSLAVRDCVKVLRANAQPEQPDDPTQAHSLGRDAVFAISDSYRYEEGYVEQRRVKVVPYDADDDGHADNPLAFDEVVFAGRLDQPWNTDGLPQPTGRGTGLYRTWAYLCFWERYTDLDGYEYYRPLVRDRDILDLDTVGWDISSWQTGQIAYSIAGLDITALAASLVPAGLTASVPPGSFIQIGLDRDTGLVAFLPETDDRRFMVREGRSLTWDKRDLEEEGLLFNWKHYAPIDHRIDVAVSNIIDMFVLPDEYYREIQEWLDRGAKAGQMPEPPTPEDLRVTFAELNGYKSASDEMIWHPVRFKVLFGDTADEELRAKFQVVRLPNSTLSESEIKSRVIQGVKDFFDVKNWDFGESFYYTELAAYLHQKLATEIASVVIVPLNEEAKFGMLFQVKAEADEIFLSTARVTDVQIVRNYTQTNLRIGN